MTAPPSAPPISRSWARPWTLVRSQHLWFLAVGAYNTAFGYAVFAGIHLAAPHLHYMLVLLVTHVISTLNAFVAYRRLVFRVKGNVLRDLMRFWTVYAGSLAFNAVTLPVLVEVFGFGVLLAQLLVVGGVAVISWFGHKHFSFARRLAEVSP